MLPLVVGCSTRIDVSGLTFAPPGGEVLSGQDVTPEVAGTPESITCSRFYHCVVSQSNGDGDYELCKQQVLSAESAQVNSVETCRLSKCNSSDWLPGSPTFNADTMLECLLTSCRKEIIVCAGGHGEATCEQFLEQWKNQYDGMTSCPESADNLCVLEFLEVTAEVEQQRLENLLDCLNLFAHGWRDFENHCRPICD